MSCYSPFCLFFNDTATTEIYTLSLHDALPICVRADRPPPRLLPAGGPRRGSPRRARRPPERPGGARELGAAHGLDRKSTRLNSSHANISYAVFCLKKKTKKILVGHVHDSTLPP